MPVGSLPLQGKQLLRSIFQIFAEVKIPLLMLLPLMERLSVMAIFDSSTAPGSGRCLSQISTFLVKLMMSTLLRKTIIQREGRQPFHLTLEQLL